MSFVSARIVSSLANLIERECTLYEKYINILKEERGNITNFNAEKVNELTQKRANLYENMLKAQDDRLALMRSFPEGQGKKLRDLIESFCTPIDRIKLLPLANKLKALVEEAQLESKEQSQILNFGLKLVHGIMSLFWSATQNVVRSYSKKGASKEAFNPATRTSNVLKRA